MKSAVKVYEVFCKVVGEEVARVLASYLGEVEKRKAATGEELRETELRLRKEIEELRLELERVKSSLIKWVFAFWAGQVLSIVALLRYLLS